MAFDFPNTPTEGQQFTPSGGPTYIYHAPAWELVTGTGGGASIFISDIAPGSAADNSLWWESDSGLLYIRYNDGTSAQWVIATPQPDTATFLIKGAQTLTATEQQQVRQNVFAAPFDALAYNGMQVNGAMEIKQEKGTASTTTNETFICDEWRLSFAGSMAVTATPVNSVGFLPGIPNLISLAVNTAQASLSAGHYVEIYCLIEGYRIARLGWGTANARPITIAFWCAHHRAGTYSIAVTNADYSRSYAATYTQNSADTLEYKTITIPGDVTGAWNADNMPAMALNFTVADGGGSTTSPNAWVAGAFIAATGQVNGVAATSDIFRITGVTVLPGNEAPSAERSPYIMRSYADELLTCMRYWQVVTITTVGAVAPTAAGDHYSSHQLKVVMRANPTLSTLGTPGLVNCTYATDYGDNRNFRLSLRNTAAGGFLVSSLYIVCNARM